VYQQNCDLFDDPVVQLINSTVTGLLPEQFIRIWAFGEVWLLNMQFWSGSIDRIIQIYGLHENCFPLNAKFNFTIKDLDLNKINGSAKISIDTNNGRDHDWELFFNFENILIRDSLVSKGFFHIDSLYAPKSFLLKNISILDSIFDSDSLFVEI